MESTQPVSAQGPVRLTDREDFETFVSTHPVVLVEFYTSGCGICQRMEPALGLVAKATDAAVGMINAGADLGLSGDYAIRSVPTLVLFVNGDVVGRLDDGYQDVESMVALIEAHT